MSISSDAVENMWRSILMEAGYIDLASTFDKKTLLSIAQELRSGPMEKVEKDFKGRGRAFKWEVMSQRFILDRLYAVDSIIAPTGQEGVNFAFDVTLNPQDVTKKVEKHLFLNEKVWPNAGLGIVKSAVVLLIPEPNWGTQWGWGLCSKSQKEALVDEAIDILVAMEERTSIVTKWVITF